MNCLVTGGAGFIGRWVVRRLLLDGHHVLAVDDLSNGRVENLREFDGRAGYLGLKQADIKDSGALRSIFECDWDFVFHLGASIHVQKSIDDPETTFRNDAEGTFRVLEECRSQYFRLNGLRLKDRTFNFETDIPRLIDRRPRVGVMSTCMVYDAANADAINENHPYRAASPYAAAKIAADHLALSYFMAYRLPVTVVRPFNTYGPFQKSNSEGGVVSIFLKRDIEGEHLRVKGTGEQTRDLLYVEDCAEFVVRCVQETRAEGQIVNAGTGADVSISRLAEMCLTEGNTIELAPHDHPQAEIMRLCCDPRKASELLQWTPTTGLAEGLERTRRWLGENRWAW